MLEKQKIKMYIFITNNNNNNNLRTCTISDYIMFNVQLHNKIKIARTQILFKLHVFISGITIILTMIENISYKTIHNEQNYMHVVWFRWKQSHYNIYTKALMQYYFSAYILTTQWIIRKRRAVIANLFSND